jgi:arabinose-5-phosphate isomerase
LLREAQQRNHDILSLTAGECMTANPKTIASSEFATTALNIMEEKKITSLVVTGKDGEVEGIIHLHDLWGTQMV